MTITEQPTRANVARCLAGIIAGGGHVALGAKLHGYFTMAYPGEDEAIAFAMLEHNAEHVLDLEHPCGSLEC